MVHNVVSLHQLQKSVYLPSGPKCLKDKEEMHYVHYDVDTAPYLGQLGLIVLLCLVVESKDKHREIWDDEKHDLVAHEDAKDVHANVLSSEKCLSLSLVSEPSLNNLVEKDRS